MKTRKLNSSLIVVFILLTSCFESNQIIPTYNKPNEQVSATQIITKEATESILNIPTKQIQIKQPTISTGQLGLDEIVLATLSPDGNTIAISGAKGVYLYDSYSLEYKGSKSILAYGLAFHPNSQILALVHDGIMEFWDIKSGDLKYFTGNTKSDLGSIGRNIAFSPDGKYIAFKTTGVCDGVDSKFEVINVSNGEVIIQRETCAHWVDPVFSFSQDSKKLTLGYMNDNLPRDTPPFYVEVIDMVSGNTVIDKPKIWVTDANNDGHTVAISDILNFPALTNRNSWILDLNNDKRVVEIPYPESFIAFSSDGDHFLVNQRGEILLQNISTRQVECNFGEYGNVGASFDKDGDKFILWNNKAIYLVDTKNC